ncbi:FitA-like ribbon-helix-helix domain-containing protein [Sinomonas halotolerans]|uniref:Antitoxin FitA-like ribbon-helix-helix domain-containing protein n=1 Tax=Sinomonas halotolerans TaxID=1644133 RepID=A0ABU9WZC4_9MICC
MTVNITIRNVPDDVRDVLAERARREGRSLQEYLSAELARLASAPRPVDFYFEVGVAARLDGVRLHSADLTAAVEADRR